MDRKLTDEQIAAAEEMIARRMENTGETREQACEHIATWLRNDASLL